AGQICISQKPAACFRVDRQGANRLFRRVVIQRYGRGTNLADGHDACFQAVMDEQLNFTGFGLVLANNAIGMHLFSPNISGVFFSEIGSSSLYRTVGTDVGQLDLLSAYLPKIHSILSLPGISSD